MSQKRKRKPLRADSGKRARGARDEALPFDAWLDAALQLKESRSFDKFESLLLDQYNSSHACVDDRAMCAYELALLYCQQGSFAQADFYLSELGFKYRLGSQIWDFRDAPRESSAASSGALACFEDVLPEPLLERLLRALAPQSAFWAEHAYPTDAFFSYNTKISAGSQHGKGSKNKKSGKSLGCEDNLIAQLAAYLLPLVCRSFPGKDVQSIQSVEWWAHTRPNGPAAGHRFHYDLDESRLRSPEGAEGVRDASIHPAVSSVLYLDDGGSSGAPTVVLDQKISGESADRAWMCLPKTARLLLFDGSLLHGVPPHICDADAQSGTRLTLMIGWWGPQVYTMSQSSALGPNMVMPDPSRQSPHAWPALFRPLSVADMASSKSIGTAQLATDAIVSVKNGVWEKVQSNKRKQQRDLPAISRNDVLFVGNWFLKSRGELNDEITKSIDPGSAGKETEPMAKVVASSDLGWLSIEDLKKLRGDA